MNSKFDFSRFKKVIVYDYHQYIHRFGVVLAVLAGIPTILVWLSSFSFSSWTTSLIATGEMPGISPYIRYTSINYAFWLVVFIAPAWLYGFVNMKKDGPQYATLPATYLEKFVSILFYTLIVTPIVFMVGCLAMDTLLTLLPWGGYKEFIWQLNMGEFLDEFAGFNYTDMFGDWVWPLSVLSVVSTSSLMFFFSTIFKKHKVAKTAGVMFLLGFILLIATLASLPSIVEYFNNNPIVLEEYFYDYINDRLLPLIYYSTFAISIVQTVVCYLWGYYRMKRMKF